MDRDPFGEEASPVLNVEALPPDVGGIIFDCDGTLVDTAPIYARAWAAGFRSSGKEMAHDWYLARAGMSEYVLMDAFEAQERIKLDRAEVVRLMRAHFLEGLHDLREIEAVSAIARQNRHRVPMAVASGGPEAIVSATLRATGLMQLFDTVVTIDDVGRAKPAPDLFLEAARRLRLPPERCLVFEDSHQGLIAAKNAGMRSVDVAEILRPV